MLHPVMPDATTNIYRQLGLKDDVILIDPASLKWGELSAGTAIGEYEAVFPQIDKTSVMNEINEQAGPQGSPPATPSTASEPGTSGGEGSAAETVAVPAEENFITIDDFLKVELRVGEIRVAERIPKADKLLRFEVDLGEEKPRQILAGLAEYYEPEKLIGRKVVVVANLKPRKMRGLESQGMICAASLEDDSGPNPALAAFLEDVEIGARLK
jgi:methionyl-tRNA synthetase